MRKDKDSSSGSSATPRQPQQHLMFTIDSELGTILSLSYLILGRFFHLTMNGHRIMFPHVFPQLVVLYRKVLEPLEGGDLTGRRGSLGTGFWRLCKFPLLPVLCFLDCCNSDIRVSALGSCHLKSLLLELILSDFQSPQGQVMELRLTVKWWTPAKCEQCDFRTCSQHLMSHPLPRTNI